MKHEAMVMIIDRLIDSGMKDADALLLVGKLLYEESKEFLAAIGEEDDDMDSTVFFS